MKKLLLATVALGWFALDADPARAQCNGIFPNNTVCANITGAGNTPRATALSSIPCSLATTVTAGCIPAIPNNTTTFLRGDLSFAGLNFAAMPSINNSTVLGNFSGGSAVPSANSVPSCANDGLRALTNPSSGGFACTTLSTGSGDVVGPGSSTDNAAARFDLTTGKLIQNSALVIADTTGALSRTGGGGIPIEASNTNSTTAVGNVGQLVESTVLVGSAVALTTNTAANVTSISLPAGNWLVWGNVATATGVGTIMTRIIASISTTSATHNTIPAGGGYNRIGDFNFGASSDLVLVTGSRHLSLSGTTTVYLVTTMVFTTSTMSAFGYIGAIKLP